MKHNITKGILYLDNQPCNINKFNMISINLMFSKLPQNIVC